MRFQIFFTSRLVSAFAWKLGTLILSADKVLRWKPPHGFCRPAFHCNINNSSGLPIIFKTAWNFVACFATPFQLSVMFDWCHFEEVDFNVMLTFDKRIIFPIFNWWDIEDIEKTLTGNLDWCWSWNICHIFVQVESVGAFSENNNCLTLVKLFKAKSYSFKWEGIWLQYKLVSCLLLSDQNIRHEIFFHW